ncbi:hypothetical protein HPB48_011312 [Haemaphysalis longicornis]|uniref:Uncharacterized protein n=1 Tax=Haemaphysalis longicornis TaxID=44386 RepID=A0A9J6G1Y1_HAELO|nr:hypothetical protein HPB48_011312 [Haemaphysalis longicornis]
MHAHADDSLHTVTTEIIPQPTKKRMGDLECAALGLSYGLSFNLMRRRRIKPTTYSVSCISRAYSPMCCSNTSLPNTYLPQTRHVTVTTLDSSQMTKKWKPTSR